MEDKIFRVKIKDDFLGVFYRKNDEFIVTDYGNYYFITEGVFKGEKLLKSHCKRTYSPEAIHRASILKPENIEGCKDRIKTWKSDLLMLEAQVLNLKKEISVEDEVIEILNSNK